MKRLLKLFLTFFKIGGLTIGGGYAMVPIIHKEIVDNKKLLSDEQFLDIMAVAQSLPGIIAVNVSTFIGYQLYGVFGAMLLALAVILPSFIIILLLANVILLYKDSVILTKIFMGIRPAIVGLMIYSVIKLGRLLDYKWFVTSIVILSVVLVVGVGLSPIIALSLSAILGMIYGKVNNYEHLD